MLTMTFDEFEKLHLGQMVHETGRKERCFIDNYLQKHLTINIYGIEGLTLSYINKYEKIYASDIISTFSISKATASQTLQRLKKKGLITQSFSRDHRSKEIQMTELGKKSLKELNEAFVEITTSLEKDFSPEEKKTLSKLLFKLRTNAVNANKEVIKNGKEKIS